MKYYGITPISNFIDNPRVKTFHADMFHGLAERDGKEFPHDTHVFADTDSPSNLLISRTGRHVPDICQPSSHLVVSEHYANELERLPHIRLMPIKFKRLVDVDYEKGDLSWADRWGNVDPCELLRTQPDLPEIHNQIGRYFEVQGYRWRDVVEKYPSAREKQIEEMTPPLQQTNIIRLSTEMLEDYPVLCFGTTILSEEAYRILASGFDRDFFIIREYNLGDDE
jgi:hypothetical protein